MWDVDSQAEVFMFPFCEGERTCQNISKRGSTVTAVDTVSHHLRCLILVLEELSVHIFILWATCIYTVRMRLEFDNQKANVLSLETILGWKKANLLSLSENL